MTRPDGISDEAWDAARTVAGGDPCFEKTVEIAKLYDQALERGKVLGRAEQWQDMQSAPRDGQWIIVSWEGRSLPAKYLDNSDKASAWRGWVTPSLWPRPRAAEPDAWMPFPAQAIREGGKDV